MLKFSEKPEGGVETFIGPSVRLDGKFSAQGDVVVEGELNGSLRTAGVLKVGKTAKIVANVEAASVFVGGEVRGNVKAKEKLELEATGKIFGDVEVKTLQVANGAILQGKCTMVKEDIKPTSLDVNKPKR